MELISLVQKVRSSYESAVGNKSRCKFLLEYCSELVKKSESISSNDNHNQLFETVKKCHEFVEMYGGRRWKLYMLDSLINNDCIDAKFQNLTADLTACSNLLGLTGYTDLLEMSKQVAEEDLRQWSAAINELKQIQIHMDTMSNDIVGLNQSWILTNEVIQESNENVIEAINRLAKTQQDANAVISKNMKDLILEVRESLRVSIIDETSTLLKAVHDDENHEANFNYHDSFRYNVKALDSAVLKWERSDLTLIGQGEFAAVYSCIYANRPCALKHFARCSSFSSHDIKKIERECRIMTHIHHKNIIGFLGANITESCVMVMELAHCSLYEILYKEKLFPGPLGAQYSWSNHPLAANHELQCILLLHVARALRYLHYHDIIHRDIKPQNVLIVPDSNGSWVAKVADFGLAIAISLTSSTSKFNNHSATGTCAYMAPELIDTEKNAIITDKVDVYSFGVLASELLVRCPPWQGFLQAQIIRSVCDKGGRPPHKFEPSQNTSYSNRDKALAKIIGHAKKGCLAQEPALRPDFSLLCAKLTSAQENQLPFKVSKSKKSKEDTHNESNNDQTLLESQYELREIKNVIVGKMSSMVFYKNKLFGSRRKALKGKEISVWDIYNLSTTEPNTVGTDGGYKSNITAIVIFDHRLYSGTSDGTLSVWNVDEIKNTHLYQIKETFGIESLACNHQHKLLFSGSFDGSIRIYDIKEVACILLCHFEDVHSGHVTCLLSSENLLFSSSNKVVFVWDTITHKQLHQLKDNVPDICSLATFNDKLYSGSQHVGDIVVWDLTLHVKTKSLIGHTSGVTTMIVNDSFLYSGSCDYTIRVWCLNSDTEVFCTKNHTDFVWKLAIYNDELYSCSSDKTLRIWEFKINSRK